jgi:hypothetical protein
MLTQVMACCLMLINPGEMTGSGYLLDNMLYALHRLSQPGLTTSAVPGYYVSGRGELGEETRRGASWQFRCQTRSLH